MIVLLHIHDRISVTRIVNLRLDALESLTISRRNHLSVGDSRAFSVCRLCTNSIHDRRVLEVVDICLRRVGRLSAAWLKDVVHVEVVSLFDGTLDG